MAFLTMGFNRASQWGLHIHPLYVRYGLPSMGQQRSFPLTVRCRAAATSSQGGGPNKSSVQIRAQLPNSPLPVSWSP